MDSIGHDGGTASERAADELIDGKTEIQEEGDEDIAAGFWLMSFRVGIMGIIVPCFGQLRHEKPFRY